MSEEPEVTTEPATAPPPLPEEPEETAVNPELPPQETVVETGAIEATEPVELEEPEKVSFSVTQDPDRYAAAHALQTELFKEDGIILGLEACEDILEGKIERPKPPSPDPEPEPEPVEEPE